MQSGFPARLLTLLRCPIDDGPLAGGAGCESPFVADGIVRCQSCQQTYRIRDGILSLLVTPLHPESAEEMRLRDERNAAVLAGRQEWTSRFSEVTEVAPTLAAVAARPRMVVGELGCGAGRYTLPLAQQGAITVAVDVSLDGLRVVRQKLGPHADVALVQADVTRRLFAPRSLDGVLSTLHSNLPDRDHRIACIRQVADALKDDGRAVISMHHYALRDVVVGRPAAGRYEDSGIYRYYMTRSEAVRESSPCFGRVQVSYLSVSLPGIKAPLWAYTAARVPILRSAFGRLFLAVLTRPRRSQPARARQEREQEATDAALRH